MGGRNAPFPQQRVGSAYTPAGRGITVLSRARVMREGAITCSKGPVHKCATIPDRRGPISCLRSYYRLERVFDFLRPFVLQTVLA